MEWLNSGWGVTVLAALISTAVTLAFRWWDRTAVEWVLVAEAHGSTLPGRDGQTKFTLIAHNAGTGTAYDVRTRRRRGPRYEEWHEFEAAVVRPGEIVTITEHTSDWDALELDLSWTASPTRPCKPFRRKGGRRTSIRLRPAQQWSHDGLLGPGGQTFPRLPGEPA